MQVSGRDVEDTTYTLMWEQHCCSWAITDKAALKPSFSEAQQQIIDILESEDRNWPTAEVIKKSGKSKQTVGNTLSKLKESGHILNPEHGQWRRNIKYTNTFPIRPNFEF